jgi:hypothetical protein
MRHRAVIVDVAMMNFGAAGLCVRTNNATWMELHNVSPSTSVPAASTEALVSANLALRHLALLECRLRSRKRSPKTKRC